MVAIDQTNYLNLENVLIYEVIGSPTLFLLLCFVLLTFFGLKYNIPTKIIMIFMIFVSLLTQFSAPELGLIITVIITVLGILLYKAIYMFMNKDR
jgi:hypothetical protein